MRIREHLRQTLLTSAIAASPMVTFAADGQFHKATEQSQLQAADARSVLRQVPQTSDQRGQVQQVLYREPAGGDQTSSVNAELQQVFRENGQTAPAMPSRHRSTMAPKSIRLVQHAETGKKQDGGNANKSDQPKKPSLLRRWFGKLTGGKSDNSGDEGAPRQNDITSDNDNPYLNSGQPTQKLPAPPPIDYNVRGGSTNGSIPARATGYQQAPGQMHPAPAYPQQQNVIQPFIQGSGVQEGYQQPTINQPGVGGYQPSPQPARQIPRDDGFIDPFGGQGLTLQEETILDLDSLIEGTNPTSTGAQNELQPSYTQAEKSLPKLSVDPDEGVSQSAAHGPANGPFTGYRLDADGPLMERPVVKPAASISTQPATKVERQETAAVSEPSAAVLEDTLDLTVPLIEEEEFAEPELELPPAVMTIKSAKKSETTFEEIPLLETTEDDAEPWKPEIQEAASAFSEEATSDVKSPPEPEFQTADKSFTEPDADRIRVLDSRARQEQQRYRIMARTGQTGFKGFCPVTLRDQRDLIDSREEYKAKFGLQTYYFASPEAKSAFEANPARYAPAAGGSDVVLLVNTGEDTPGALDFSLWYRDRLYMFRSRETQAIFSKNPVQYANQY